MSDIWLLLGGSLVAATICFLAHKALRVAHFKYIKFKRSRGFQKKFRNYKYWFPAVILGLLSFPAITYLLKFYSHPISSTAAEWGQMGDFFGGMLNPILAFASFIALLYTIRIQSEEPRLTREELSKSVMAQQQLVDSQNAQTSFSASLEDYNSIRQLLVAALTELRANFYANSESDESIRSLRVAYQVFQLDKNIDLNQIDVWHVISSDFRNRINYDHTLTTRGSILCNLAYDALSNYEHISSIANSKLKGHFQASLKSYAESVAIYIVFAKLFAPRAKYGKSEIRCKMLFEEIERICREKELPAPPFTLLSADPACR